MSLKWHPFAPPQQVVLDTTYCNNSVPSTMPNIFTTFPLRPTIEAPKPVIILTTNVATIQLYRWLSKVFGHISPVLNSFLVIILLKSEANRERNHLTEFWLEWKIWLAWKFWQWPWQEGKQSTYSLLARMHKQRRHFTVLLQHLQHHQNPVCSSSLSGTLLVYHSR